MWIAFCALHKQGQCMEVQINIIQFLSVKLWHDSPQIVRSAQSHSIEINLSLNLMNLIKTI